MEFHELFYGITWNPVSFEMAPSVFNGIPRKSVKFYLSTQVFHGIQWNIPWNSKGKPMLIHRSISQIPRILWNLELCGIWLMIPWSSMEYSMEFHGIMSHLKLCPPCSMKFHGFRWYLFCRRKSYMELQGNPMLISVTFSKSHGIPWNLIVIVPWNSTGLDDIPFCSTRVPWNSMNIVWIFMEFRVTPRSMELLKFHGIPWNFSTGYGNFVEFHGIWLCSQIPWNF